MSKPDFREINECYLSEDYDHEAPLDLNLVRSDAHRKASQQLLLRKKSSIHNWDKSEIEISHDSFHETALIKLLINENDLLFKNVSRPLRKKSLAQKYFFYLNSNEIWSLMYKKTNCGNTFYQCINEANEDIFGYVL
jgi:hypothetical protein